MPGIITHNRILKESVDFLSKRKKKGYSLRSIEALLSSREFLRSALFGSIGPNIFDYVPLGRKGAQFGNSFSFLLHDGEYERLIQRMIRKIQEYSDFNTSWAAIQRAYLYGFISHMVSDALFHPFVFYFSGFPVSGKKNEISYYREQNLLFQYNIDIYYQYYNDKADEYRFSLEEMLPVRKSRWPLKLDDAVKSFILESIQSEFPENYKNITFFTSKETVGKGTKTIGYLDIIPRFMVWAYRLKWTKNRRLADIIKDVRRRKLLFSDFIVRYPWNKKINRDLLNIHRERWQYPAGGTGYIYDSVDNLLTGSIERTVEIWEKIESSLYEKKEPGVEDLLAINSYTGEAGKRYKDMINMNPKKMSL